MFAFGKYIRLGIHTEHILVGRRVIDESQTHYVYVYIDCDLYSQKIADAKFCHWMHL